MLRTRFGFRSRQGDPHVTSPTSAVAIVGATATGKSALGLEAARRFGCEIVSVDSMQFYRGLDIGTAKPSGSERVAIPHHLIDLVDPDQEFSVADFQDALQVVRRDLAERSTSPLYVGGTGLHLRCVVDGLDLPGSWPEIRTRLEQRVERDGLADLRADLERLDPVANARIEAGNARRIIRALEVVEGSGRLFSSFGPGFTTYPESPVRQIGLRWDRGVLADRIRQRVDVMFRSGLVDEVTRLLDAGVRLSRTAAHAVGYREIIDHLNGQMTLEQARESMVTRTRQLAVRQDRWFRRDPRIRWIDVNQDPVGESWSVVEEAMEQCLRA
jgi:tRNA dimethylallyltransferase